jgi:RES domain-containing protein
MILRSIGPVVAYRMHTPRWAVAPTSGAGAAMHGGRANRPGMPALYLALEPETALQEYRQLSSLMPPGTLVSYTVQVHPIVDFSRGFDGAQWPPIWDAFHDDWRHLWLDRHVEPASWVAADEALEAGAKGILFGSHMRPGGLNLVLYTEALESTDLLQVHDPRNDLPKNQDSWR